MNHKNYRMAALLLALGAGLTGCATDQSASSYAPREARREMNVRMGVVESVRPVTIQGKETPIGGATGAIIGGVAGSTIGGGRGSSLMALAGAVAGGLVGNAVEKNASKTPGLEITVRLENGQLTAITQEADEQFRPGERVRILSDGRTSRVTH